MKASRHRRLREIYAQVPDVRCKGLCTEACGPIAMSKFEAKRLSGVDLDGGETLTCAALRDGRCAIYKDRPLICRLFGAVDHDLLRCPFGCRADRPLTDAEARDLLARAADL